MFPVPFNRSTQRNYGGSPLPVRQQDDPLVGYRSWLIQPRDNTLILHSLHIYYTWETFSTAKCDLPMHPAGNPIPDPNCACGLYAQLPEHPLSEWEHMTRGRVAGSGTVALSGRVIRCDAGFKAEHALIQSPVIIEVNCSGFHDCEADVVALELSTHRPIIYGLCAAHAAEEGPVRPFKGARVDAAIWMREALRTLGRRYPDIEFLSWIGGGDI